MGDVKRKFVLVYIYIAINVINKWVVYFNVIEQLIYIFYNYTFLIKRYILNYKNDEIQILASRDSAKHKTIKPRETGLPTACSRTKLKSAKEKTLR